MLYNLHDYEKFCVGGGSQKCGGGGLPTRGSIGVCMCVCVTILHTMLF